MQRASAPFRAASSYQLPIAGNGTTKVLIMNDYDDEAPIEEGSDEYEATLDMMYPDRDSDDNHWDN